MDGVYSREKEVAEIHAMAVQLLGDGDILLTGEDNAIDKLAALHKRAANMPPRRPAAEISGHYPPVNDADLPSKVAAKQEFVFATDSQKVAATTGDDNKHVEEMWSKRCSVAHQSFELTRVQIAMRNFMLPGTPYNGLLLFHGTGVGKTCTAVTIAEMFKDIQRNGVFVLVRPGLRDNFQRTLFDPSRIGRHADGSLDFETPTQCTGTTYLDLVPGRSQMSLEQISARVAKLVRSRYTFFGLNEFSNLVDSLIEDTTKQVADERIRSHFSDSVFIIDEAHNLRSDEVSSKKKILPSLTRVLGTAGNIKLLLLTATPMFNRASDIVDLINLLKINDRQPAVPKNTLFSADGTLLPGKGTLERLHKFCNGYVSFMPGNDPFSFPTRVRPSVSGDRSVLRKQDVPRRDIRGDLIPAQDVDWLSVFEAEGLEIIVSDLGRGQLDRYGEIEQKLRKEMSKGNAGEEEEEEDAADEDTDDATNFADLREGMQLSNIAFPPGILNMTDAFQTVKSGKSMCLQYRVGVPRFLDGFKQLTSYAPKLGSIISRIERSHGVIMVYSRFIWRGIVPLAIALEHRGFKRHDANPMLVTETEEKKNQAKRPPCYAIICGNRDIQTGDVASCISTLNRDGNAEGDQIKVVLISDSGSEGIDLKFVREVHVLEPWYHINKLEQVIGRAARLCSHQALPLEHRNFTVYLHAIRRPPSSSSSNVTTETVDLRAYRLAASKQHSIRQVEKVMEDAAVDSIIMSAHKTALTSNATRINIETSQGTRLKDFPIIPAASEKQKQKHNKYDDVVDMSTYDVSRHHIPSHRMQQAIISFFNDGPGTFDDILAHVCRIIPSTGCSSDVVALELNKLLTKTISVSGGKGTIMYRGDRYVFQPENEIIEVLTDRERLLGPPTQNMDKIAFDASAMLETRPSYSDALKPYREVILPGHSPSTAVNANANASVASASSSSSASSKQGRRGVLRLVPRVDVSPTAIQATVHRVEANTTQLLDSMKLPASYRSVALDATIERSGHRQFIELALASVVGGNVPHIVNSLKGCGVLQDITGRTVVLRTPYVPYVLGVDMDSGDVRLIDETNYPLVQRHLKWDPRGINAGLIPIVRSGHAVFKLLDNNKNNLKLAESGRGSGSICHQNMLMTSAKLRKEIAAMAGMQQDVFENVDKKGLCMLLELVLRKHKPDGFLRIGQKLTVVAPPYS